MKKVFLVRKDVTKPYGKDNWQIMSLDEFKKFRTTDAAKGRHFIRLFDYDSQGTVFFKECERDELAQRRTELSRSWRKIDYMIKHDIKVVPFATTVIDDEEVSNEELIADETQDVEEIANKELLLERLRKAIKQLTPGEQILIDAFFLHKNGKSARQVARDLDLPWSTAKYRVAQILIKLREIF